MSQRARPISDISVGLWGNPSWSEIDELNPDAADGTLSADGPVGDTLEVLLSSLLDPSRSSHHQLHFHGGKSGAGALTLTWSLRQGAGTEIAAWTESPGLSQIVFTRTLTAAQTNLITNYTDLRIRFVADAPAGTRAQVNWAEMKVPQLQSVSFRSGLRVSE